MKINTSWGKAEIDVTKIKNFYCHVDVWNEKYNIIISYSNDIDTQDKITAICDGFEDMLRTCKKMHNELTNKYYGN